jgi:DNA replication protein DnaC
MGVCPICKGAGYLVKDVPVGHPDFGRTFPCRCKEEELKEKRIERLWSWGGLKQLKRMTFNSFIPDGYGLSEDKRRNLRRAYELAKEYAEKPEGWLILLGGYGCGKTHLAAAIANRQIELGMPVLFISVPDLLDHLRATFAPQSPATYDNRFEEVKNAPLLILDDLGTEAATPWAREKLYQLINYRYNSRLPTVITTNRPLEEIDPRLRSRMVDVDLSKVFTILAPDFRASGAEKEQPKLSSLYLHSEKTFEKFDLRRNELPPRERRNLEDALLLAKRYAKNPKGWLVFTGAYGCGKTHLAAAIANYRVKRGYHALFVVVPELLDHLRIAFSPHRFVSYDRHFEEVRNAPLLVLDDLKTSFTAPWAKEKFHQILDYRYNAKLPTVITMATDAEVDPRIKTRILDSTLCEVFAIEAPSYHGRRGRS